MIIILISISCNTFFPGFWNHWTENGFPESYIFFIIHVVLYIIKFKKKLLLCPDVPKHISKYVISTLIFNSSNQQQTSFHSLVTYSHNHTRCHMVSSPFLKNKSTVKIIHETNPMKKSINFVGRILLINRHK